MDNINELSPYAKQNIFMEKKKFYGNIFLDKDVESMESFFPDID